MRVAVCDDDFNDLSLVVRLLNEYDKIGQMEICQFCDAKSVYETAAQNPIDIAILDIEMDGPNGYEIARQLVTLEHKPLVIFVTHSMAYTLRGYGVAFRYLTKPVSQTELAEALDAATREIRANRFVLTVDAVSHVLRMEELYYFEVFGHHTILHTMDMEYTFRATLKEVLGQLPTGYFGMPHQSYIVNFSHVKTATVRDVHLTNGACIPISRRRQKDFEQQFYRYLGR